MKEKILKHILQIDIYGTHPRFTINGEKKFNTYIGSFMTIVSVCIIGLFFFMYAEDVIHHTNPKLITTIYNDAQSLERLITGKDFVITLSLQHSNYSNFVNEKIYNVKAGIYSYYKLNGSNNIQRNPVDVVKCSEFNFEIIPSYFKSLDLKNLYCLKNATFKIEGEYQSDSFQFLYFTFSKCDNSTSNNTCSSEDEINSILSGGYIGIFMTDKVVIPNNFSIPYQTYGKNIFSSYTVKQFTDYWIYFKSMEVYTDSGLFFKNKRENSFMAYDRAETVIDYRETTNFATINLRESTKREVYERSYTKIQEAAANAGGIVKIVTLIGNAIVYFFRQILYRNFMIQFFKFNKKDFFKINGKSGNIKHFTDNMNNKNIDFQNHTYNFKNNSKKSNFKPSKIYEIDSTPKFRVNKRNSKLSLNINHINNNSNNNSNNNNNNSNYNINNSNNLINNNSNTNILNNSNNGNNNSNKNIFNNFSQASLNYKNIPKHITSNVSIISGLQNLINNKYLETNIFTVKSSRNCFSVIFKKGCIKHIKYINIKYSKIAFLFDIVHYFKTKFEVKLIKNKLFDEEQREKLSHLYKFNYEFDADKEGFDIFYKKKDPSNFSSRSFNLRFKYNHNNSNFVIKKNN